MGDEMLITVIATGFAGSDTLLEEKREERPAARTQPQAAAPARSPFISQSTKPKNEGQSIFTSADSNGPSEFGRSFMQAFENAQHAQQTQNSPSQAAESVQPQAEDKNDDYEDIFSVPAGKSEGTLAAERRASEQEGSFEVETPKKKASSIFDDPDEDESDVLPIFKGRNIFGNN